MQKKRNFPWTGFFRSLYAREELALGKFPIKAEVSGYILAEEFWDSRQVITSNGGIQLFAPRKQKLDPRCKDINSPGEFGFSPLETRARAKLYGPKVLGAETFGLVEADFVGGGDVLARVRDRHAFVKLTWKEKQVTLLAGQWFNPIRMAHLDLDPKIIGRGRGAPVHPNARNPQVRFTKRWDNNVNLLVSGVAQLRARSPGPDGSSSIYLRRSMMPIFNTQVWLGPADTKYIFGVGFDIKRLMPRLETDKCVRTRSTTTGVSFNTFAKITAEPLSVRTQFVWSQNGADYNLLGGYAVKTLNPRTDERTYTNLTAMSYWIDFNVDKKISPGLFGGLTKDLGANGPIIPSITNSKGETESLVYARGPDIKYMVKLMPRIRFNMKPMIFGAELEWTRVGYGTLKPSGQFEDIVPVSDIRLILATFFYY